MQNANLIKIGLISVLGLAACVEAGSDDPAIQTTQPAIEESSTNVVDLNFIGTFMSDSRRPGDLTQLVLKTNGTFHSATLVACVTQPCNPVQEDGMYRISWRDSRKYLTLYSREEVLISRYQYELRDTTLRLLKVNPRGEVIADAAWLPMWFSTSAWCASPTVTAKATNVPPDDCQLQNLPIGPCAGQWSCRSGTCNWDCASPQ